MGIRREHLRGTIDGRRWSGKWAVSNPMSGRSVVTLVVFAGPEATPLLGAYTLEGLRFAPDLIGRRLVPVPGLLMEFAA